MTILVQRRRQQNAKSVAFTQHGCGAPVPLDHVFAVELQTVAPDLEKPHDDSVQSTHLRAAFAARKWSETACRGHDGVCDRFQDSCNFLSFIKLGFRRNPIFVLGSHGTSRNLIFFRSFARKSIHIPRFKRNPLLFMIFPTSQPRLGSIASATQNSVQAYVVLRVHADIAVLVEEVGVPHAERARLVLHLEEHGERVFKTLYRVKTTLLGTVQKTRLPLRT